MDRTGWSGKVDVTGCLNSDRDLCLKEGPGEDAVDLRYDTEHVILRNLLAETNTARTENAAFVIERDTRPEHNVFWLLHFVLEKTRLRIAKIDAEFLQTTFAGLIANRAIKRMIDEQKLHDAALTFLH